jgi:hypothetical protein
VGENKKAAVPSGGAKDPAQKSNIDADDRNRHLRRDISVFRDVFGPSIIPPRTALEKERETPFGLSPSKTPSVARDQSRE